MRRLRDLRTLLVDDFGAWYARELPPSGARDLLSRCGYTRMNVFVASAFWHLWANDYWYPEGGLQGFFDRWVARLEERGACFLFRRTVTSLDERGGRAAAVRTSRGERFEADEIVYTGDYRQAVHRLIGAARFSPAALARLERARHSDALVSVYLGLDLDPAALRERLRTPHVFYFPSFDCRTEIDPADPDAHRRAFLEVTAHGIRDPSLAPPGRSALVVQAFTRHDWQGGWRTGLTGDPAREAARPPPRPAAYPALKRQVAAELIEKLEGLVPGIAARIVHLDVGAPPSAVRFTRNAFGGSCGFELNLPQLPVLEPARPRGDADRELPRRRPLHGLARRSPDRRALRPDRGAPRARAALAPRRPRPRRATPRRPPTRRVRMQTMTMPPSPEQRSAAAELGRRGLAECWEILRVHGKTFHMMAKLLGPERGSDIAALYGFARVADDAVDVPAPGDTPGRGPREARLDAGGAPPGVRVARASSRASSRSARRCADTRSRSSRSTTSSQGSSWTSTAPATAPSRTSSSTATASPARSGS